MKNLIEIKVTKNRIVIINNVKNSSLSIPKEENSKITITKDFDITFKPEEEVNNKQP